MVTCYKQLQQWLAEKRAIGYEVEHESYTPVVLPPQGSVIAGAVQVIVVVRMTLQENFR